MPDILKSIRESLTVHKITSQHEMQLAGHFNICSQVVSLRLQEKLIKSGQFTAMYTNEGMQIVWTQTSLY